ncbi:MAG: nuclear transport factor 2 family protein [Crocinitomicaceae bacterium]
MKYWVFVFLGCVCTAVFAQTTSELETERFYEALNKGDATAVRSFLAEDLIVEHIGADTTFQFDLEGFMTICPKFESKTFQEKFEVQHEKNMAGEVEFVRAQFRFFLNGKQDHCGEDLFIWVLRDGVMKIKGIYSTAYDCEVEEANEITYRNDLKKTLNEKMENWHKAAANADFEAYFSLMDSNFYFLGTDPDERWSKEEFATFCQPHFEKGKAWKFETIDRNFYFSEDLKVVWFDEKLDTWMQNCRATGVFEENKYGEWKLQHYNLTVLIENEKIKAFIKLRKK